jgi:hypothetical protein
LEGLVSHVFATLSGLASASTIAVLGFLVLLLIAVVVALSTRDKDRRRAALTIVELLTRTRRR